MEVETDTEKIVKLDVCWNEERWKLIGKSEL